MSDLAHGRPAPEASGGEVSMRSSVERGPIPRQGVRQPAFVWEDVVEGPPPTGRGDGEGQYGVYHRTEVDLDARVSYSTLVTVVRREGRERVEVESRLSVQRRAFLELMDRERAFTDRVTSRWRDRLLGRLVAQRAAANRLGPGARSVAVRLIRLQARAELGLIGLVRRAMRGLAEAPDAMAMRVLRAQAHLGARWGRRSLRQGLTDPRRLSTEQRGVLLFLILSAVVASVFLVGTLLALLAPSWTDEFRHFVGDGTAAFVGAVALPIPTELLVVAATLAVGPTLAVAGSLSGKMLGVLVLYFVGGSLHAKVEQATAKRPRLHHMVAWVHANAERHGFLALVVLNAVPLLPDVLLYAFALSGMDFRRYMAGIALGTALKFGAIVAGVLVLGPDRVVEMLSNPFA